MFPVRIGLWSVLCLWVAGGLGVPREIAAGETGPELPSEENLHPLPVGEQPHVRYWLRDPASPEETPPQVVTAVAPAPAVAPMPVVAETGGTTKTIEDRRATMQDLFTQMLKKAKDAYKVKDYGRCISICRNILTADPRHKGAAEMMSQARLGEVSADKRVTELAGVRKDEEMLLESDQRAIRPPVRIPEERPYWPRRSDEPVSQRRIDMKKVLDEPVTVDFVQADLEWVLNTLFIITGVNIIADPAALEGKALTLHVEKVPLKEVLEFIVRNNDGIQYSVTDHALWITATSADDLKKIMYPKVYPIHHGLVSSRPASGMASGGGGAGGMGRSNQTGRAGAGGAGGAQGQGQGQQGQDVSYLELVLDWIASQADTQTFPDGSQYFVDKPSNNLVVYTTPAGHDKIKEFLDVFDQPPIQVLIKARFLKIRDNGEKGLGVSLDSLSGNISFGNPNNSMPYGFANLAQLGSALGTAGATQMFSLSGSRLDPKFEFTVRAILQDRKTKVLAEPQIIAVNNKEAYIDITTNFSYITDLREVEGTTFGGNGTAASNVVAYVPEFDTENIGFTLFVTPSVGRDLKTINLHLRPVVDDLAEGQNIQDFQSFEVIDANRGPNQTPPVIQRPTIDQTSLETDVVLEDNGFVIIGGLIRSARTTVEKKVPGLHRIPGLGHLFKSKSEVVDRTNLVIIIESQIITPRGRTYRTDANPDDGDVREGGANRAPGQVSDMVPPVLPPTVSPAARTQSPANTPRSMGVWKVNQEKPEPK
jgi:type II secretory pathway component GspD/PulD (secretin)